MSHIHFTNRSRGRVCMSRTVNVISACDLIDITARVVTEKFTLSARWSRLVLLRQSVCVDE